LAISLVRQEKPEKTREAISLYRRALALKPEDLATARNLAIAYFKQQRYAGGAPWLERVAHSSPSDFQAQDLAGRSLFGTAGRQSTWSVLPPSSLPTWPTLYRLGQAYLRAGNYAAVIGVFARIVKIAPDSAEARVMMGTAEDKMHRKPWPSIRPRKGQTRISLVFTPDSGSSTGSRTASILPSRNWARWISVSNCLLGEIAVRQNKLDEAQKAFTIALAGNPKYRDALLGLGEVENKLDHPEKAVDVLQRAIRIDPLDAQAHYQLGDAFDKLGRHNEAARERALSASIQARQQADYTKRLQSQTQP
jgi:tetratricopeptide (TPR) repeat protein